MDDAISYMLSTIRTLDEAYRLDDELRIIEHASYHVRTDNRLKPQTLLERIENTVSNKTYLLIRELKEKNMVNLEDEKVKGIFFELAHKRILETPRLQLQIAFQPQEDAINRIYSWARKQILGQFFLEIIEKSQLVGGCIIVYRGIYKDYSIQSTLHAKKMQIFRPILDRVGRQNHKVANKLEQN